jgi:hypothetical protein
MGKEIDLQVDSLVKTCELTVSRSERALLTIRAMVQL